MTDVEPVVTDFAASGRSGRRNALPDILGSPAGAGTSDLPHKLAELSLSEADIDQQAQGAGKSASISNSFGDTASCNLLYEGAEGEVPSSQALLESKETEGKSSDS
ncbi:cAMP-dependent protein kinase inhibitor beta isoform X1 [Pogoniulus pusillus]|uniref:cAMP-dependent protein kinase inhibitor beta isoform X1 n=1 Tax=Pogoniulus pusillus TaxID=488313 RepID=UPI0030B99AF7